MLFFFLAQAGVGVRDFVINFPTTFSTKFDFRDILCEVTKFLYKIPKSPTEKAAAAAAKANPYAYNYPWRYYRRWNSNSEPFEKYVKKDFFVQNLSQ